MTAGRIVGFKLRQSRGNTIYFAFFNGPDGKRREVSTNCTGIEKARTAARQIIDDEYTVPAEPAPPVVSWADAETRLVARLTAAGRREASVRYYRKVLRIVRTFCKGCEGPAEVSPDQAQAWADQYATAKGRCDRPRSGHTAFSTIRGAAALWDRWFVRELKLCRTSPFADVQPPKTDKPTVRVPDDVTISDFYKWLAERFGDWPLPKLFFETKALVGCRVADLCQLRADQLRDGRLHFDASQTKGRKARSVPLPDDLFSALAGVKGTRFLWDGYPKALKAVLDARKWPSHQLRPDFAPERMLQWVMTLFADFNATRPDKPKLTSHLFRKRAFTRAWEMGIDPKKAAIAIGVNPDTMFKHYVAMDEQEVTDDVFAKLTPTLRSHASHTTNEGEGAPAPQELAQSAGG